MNDQFETLGRIRRLEESDHVRHVAQPDPAPAAVDRTVLELTPALATNLVGHPESLADCVPLVMLEGADRLAVIQPLPVTSEIARRAHLI